MSYPKRFSIILLIFFVWNCMLTFFVFKIFGNIALLAKAVLLIKELLPGTWL